MELLETNLYSYIVPLQDLLQPPNLLILLLLIFSYVRYINIPYRLLETIERSDAFWIREK